MPNSANHSLRTAVVGVSGYAGGELARLLLRHPHLTSTPPVFLGRMGEPDVHPTALTQLHPELSGLPFADELQVSAFDWNSWSGSRSTSFFLQHLTSIPRLGTRRDCSRDASHRPEWSMATSLREISRRVQARRCRSGSRGQAPNGSGCMDLQSFTDPRSNRLGWSQILVAIPPRSSLRWPLSCAPI